MISACKNGNCEVLFNEDTPCYFRKKNESMMCVFLSPTTGKCMCARAQKQKKKNGIHVWAKQNSATFYEHRVKKGKL